jgi:H+/Cl- antiporter ClcA
LDRPAAWFATGLLFSLPGAQPATFKQFQWLDHFKKNWLMVIICVLIGIGSHFFWDSFTHNRGYFVKHLPLLGSTISIGALYVETPLLLQILSSLFGGYIILYALWQLPIDQKLKINHQLKPFWIRVFLLASLIFFARLIYRFPKEIADVGIPAISAFLASLLLISVFNRRSTA